jgi:hypothetical protein
MADELVRAASPRRRWRMVAWATPALAAAAVLLLWLRPDHHGFRARGTASGPSIEAVCSDGDLARCHPGEKLMFRVSAIDEPAWLLGYAEMPDHERLWLAPDGEGLSVAPSTEPLVLTQAIALTPALPSGEFVIHLVLGKRPLSRAELLDPPDGAILARATTRMSIGP